ncbi:hypothetical protein F2Q68_00024350 [Brassica cretica]|uniref:Uncharacterized protein n=1 Tax=Brassica cretica TaxID=69181 RepID=A0A8S9IFN3_BRACR|nr:hypothetical protein F2Q68_00024350 [Brassica cretica]
MRVEQKQRRSEKPEASIDYSTLIPSLNEALLEACGAFSADLLLVRYLQRLESIFTGVPFPCDVLFTDPLSSELNASQSSVHAGLKAWVHNLLPLLLVDNSQKTHQWTELILDIVEKILAKPGTLEELVGSPSWESHVVIPITSLKTMLRDARKIAIWCLMENVDCWRHWDNLYKMNVKVGAALLKTLVDEWKDHSFKLPSSPSDAVILGHAMKSFRLKNKKGISEKGEKASLYKEADKYCKLISRKLSSHQGTCTITAVVLFTALTTAALVLFCLSVFGYLK